MKLHFVSRNYAVPLAFQAQLAGAKVTVHNPDLSIGSGIFPCVASPKPPKGCDAVIVDGAGWGKTVDGYRKDGHRVLFGGAWPELVNLKPEFQVAVLQKAGFPEPPPLPDVPFTLIVGGWYENGWREPYYIGVVRDRLLAGDVGAPCGVTAAELEPIDADSPLVADVLHPLTDSIGDYAGLLSVMVQPDGYSLHVTGLMAGVQPQVIEAVSEMVYGGFTSLVSMAGAKASGDKAISVALSVPPWPYGAGVPDAPIRFALDAGQSKHVWPLDVTYKDSEYQYAGTIGMIGSVSARGRATWTRPDNWNPEWREPLTGHAEARARTYKLIRRLDIPLLQYRTDIGRHTNKALAPLRAINAAV